MNAEDDFRPDPSDEQAQRIAYLINGYIRKNLTGAEHRELDEWVTASHRNQILFEELTDPANINKWISWKERLNTGAALDRVREKLGMPQEIPGKERKIFWPAIITAAAILTIAVFVTRFYRSATIVKTPQLSEVRDLMPGGNHAILTLEDGTHIVLDTVKMGALLSTKNGTITKDSAGIHYTSGVRPAGVTQYNELNTPPGGEFKIQLSDGTKVWLNASSSVRYPEIFSDSVRRVEITGEVYFEVSPDPAHPFMVRAGNNEVRVLGTHFNVSHYPDMERTVVTLAEGSVRLNGNVLLKPGQQGIINDESGTIKTEKADLEAALAWKEGQFIFRGTSLEEVMQQISHWYDAKIVYKDNVSEHFNASIPRNVPVSKLLHLLEATGRVHFKIEDKKIIVMN